jgi:hypothetical protein
MRETYTERRYTNGSNVIVSITSPGQDNIAVVRYSNGTSVTYAGFSDYWIFDKSLVLEYVSELGATYKMYNMASADAHNELSCEWNNKVTVVGINDDDLKCLDYGVIQHIRLIK